MAFIPTPNTAKVTISFSLNSQVMQITLWFEAEVTFTSETLLDLAEEVADWVVAELMPLLSDQVGVNNVNATSQESESAPSVDWAIDPVVLGSQSGAPMPQNVAAVATFRTEARGRSFRGRNYVSGFPSTAQSAIGVLSPTAQGNLASAYAALADVELAQDVTHVVTSHFADGAARAEGLNTPVLTYTVDPPLDSQRRRLPGRGE